MTTMTGSQNQIDWANNLRTRVERWIAKAKSELPTDKHAQLDGMFAKVLQQTDAAWWIDNIGTAGVGEITEDLLRTAGNHEINPGNWQPNLRMVVAINNKL